MPTVQHVLDRLLAGFVRGNTDFAATVEFRNISAPIIRGLARRFGPDLPADLIDEVVSETYVLLLGTAGKSFEVNRGSAQKFLFGVAANAVKNVRASYRPPAIPSRRRGKGVTDDQPSVVAFNELHHATGSRLLPDVRQAETAIDVEAVLAGITAVMAAAIIAVYVHGEKTSSAARAFGVSRFQIRRVMQHVRTTAQIYRGRGRAKRQTTAA
jgi:DNA-directed RNA polymerase specialized sigma24 family protein